MFYRQNIFFKLLFCLVSFYSILKLQNISLILLFFLLNPRIYMVFFGVLKRILPFFAIYLFFGLLFSIDFNLQLLFCLKLILFILLSVYLTKTTDIQRFSSDIYFMKRVSPRLLFFIISLISFINIMLSMRYSHLKDLFSGNIKNTIRDIELKTNRVIESLTPNNINWLANIWVVIYTIILALFALFGIGVL